MELLYELLSQVRLRGALFLNAEFREPWCVDAPQGAAMAEQLLPRARKLAICHYVLQGRCWAGVKGHAPLPLDAGDVVVFPDGDAHLVGSGLQHAPVSLHHVVDPRVPELRRLRYGGNGDSSVLVCGWFSYERELPHPLLGMLPPLFRAQISRRPIGPWLEQSIRQALAGVGARQSGAQLMASKLAEALFLEAISAHLETLPATEIGWLGAMRDPQIGHALTLLHARPGQHWQVQQLAQQVHMSRTAFALRFAELTGAPPMHYLKRLRLSRAAQLLVGEENALSRVAESVGYESETAFNRAFKQAYGESPGSWRRRHRSADTQAAAPAL